jgi:hypothetical protein
VACFTNSSALCSSTRSLCCIFIVTGLCCIYTGWSIDNVKKLLQSLIESGIIYTWTEARLYRLLLTKGVLNLEYKNRHSQFFKNRRHTEEGCKAIEEYTHSEFEDVPDLLKVTTDPNEE